MSSSRAIASLPPGRPRPFWSVMIPTYHCADYLRHTLRSVLAQAPPPDQMQIEVVDDASFKDDPEAVVRELGQGRVAFFRQVANAGPQRTFTTCVERAQGEWVHILHGDDMVRPGFYEAMRRGAERDPAIHAAFCRVITIDEHNEWIDLSQREAATAGVVPDLIDRLAVCNLIMFPSIVVRRSAYEQLGASIPTCSTPPTGICGSASPPASACGTTRSRSRCTGSIAVSDTSRLMQTGANIRDARHAIAIAEAYLPPGRVALLTRKARLYHALYAMELARERALRGEWGPAMAQLRAGLSCSASPRVWAAALGLTPKAHDALAAQGAARESHGDGAGRGRAMASPPSGVCLRRRARRRSPAA